MSSNDATVKSISSTDDGPPQELTAVVDDLLNQLTTKFSAISSDMLSKMDDMSKRIDSLEATIQEHSRQSQDEDPKPA